MMGTEQYAIDSEVIDPSTQKGFLIGLYGMVELSMSAILEHAKGNGLPGQYFCRFVGRRSSGVSYITPPFIRGVASNWLTPLFLYN